MIFVPTIPHTGTWFIMRFLNNFISEIKEAVEILKDDNIQYDASQDIIVHTHFPILNPTSNITDLGNNESEIQKRISLDAIDFISRFFKTVIPIRDPLAAILTREARHPELRHFFIIEGFIQVATKLAKNRNVKFVPIDLYKTAEERKKLLLEIMSHCEIPVGEDEVKLIEYIAKEWKTENDTPNNVLRKHYINKDINRINALLDHKIAEVNYLKNHASIILPFLSGLGYTKGDLNLW